MVAHLSKKSFYQKNLRFLLFAVGEKGSSAQKQTYPTLRVAREGFVFEEPFLHALPTEGRERLKSVEERTFFEKGEALQKT
jgi:hypothetical protein